MSKYLAHLAADFPRIDSGQLGDNVLQLCHLYTSLTHHSNDFLMSFS